MAFSDLKSFYRSTEWKKFRSNYLADRLAKDGEFIDDITHKPILNSYDVILHHKEHLTEQNVLDYNISLNPDNIQLVSFKTHNLIHQKGFKAKKVYVVYGSPSSGKTTYVNEVVSPDDLIIDIDRIYESINNNRSNKLLSVVMEVHRHLLDTVRVRKGQWANAYIMIANLINVKRIAEQVDADKIIHIDTPREICYQRAKTKINRFDGYEEYLNKYWEQVENNQLLLEELNNY